jgi:chromate transporter
MKGGQTERPGPRSRADLFRSFTWLALQGFGGVIAVVQRELVERKRWLSLEEFAEDWAVAQTLPGPNVVNLSLMIGERSFGLSGALAALAGLLVMPLVLVITLATLAAGMTHVPAVDGAMRGMGAVAAGLIAATALKLTGTLRTNVMGSPACSLFGAATFVAIGVFRVPLAYALLTVGPLAGWWAYRRLGRSSGDAEATR